MIRHCNNSSSMHGYVSNNVETIEKKKNYFGLMNLNILFSTNEATFVRTCFFNLVYLYYHNYHIPTCLEHVSVVQ